MKIYKQTISIYSFIFTIFLSAFLLFLVQPLIAKQILPLFGGSSSVWNVCMLFFQVLLLGGYLYAHFLTKLFTRKKQFIIHICLLFLSLSLLPIGLSSVNHQLSSPTLMLLLLLTVSIGGPFFFLSAGSPLIQKWFWYSQEKSVNPYYLYSASNIGSILALVAYPFIIEPNTSVKIQLMSWSIFYVVLVMMYIILGFQIGKNIKHNDNVIKPQEKISKITLIKWITLAFFPSSLMLGVTQYITSNIVAVPLIWIVPLAIYLLTFILAFAKNSKYEEKQFIPIFYLSFIAFGFIYVRNLSFAPFYVMEFNLLIFALAALLCHCRLVITKPLPENLTIFYLCLSIGGALGGIFNALLAPLVFTTTIEYPLIMFFVAIYFLPSLKFHQLSKTMKILLPSFLALFVLYAIGYKDNSPAHKIIERKRNFYGTFTVEEKILNGVKIKSLVHGTTLHGMQAEKPYDKVVSTYYNSLHPTFSYIEKENLSVAAIGLGVGTVACLAKENQNWTFYEIDTGIVELSVPKNEKEPRFTYIKSCKPDAKIIIGDARLEMSKLSENIRYDVIILDAFSSDSIPAHLVTKEAFDLYTSHLAQDGIILIHISNQYLDLSSVLANIADISGYFARLKVFNISDEKDLFFREKDLYRSSVWFMMTKNEKALAGFDNWKKPALAPKIGVWTDDYYNIFDIIVRSPDTKFIR